MKYSILILVPLISTVFSKPNPIQRKCEKFVNKNLNEFKESSGKETANYLDDDLFQYLFDLQGKLKAFHEDMEEKAILEKQMIHEDAVFTEQIFGVYESIDKANALSMYFQAAIDWIDFRKDFINKDYRNALNDIRNKIIEAKNSMDSIKAVRIEHNVKSNELNNKILQSHVDGEEQENQQQNEEIIELINKVEELEQIITNQIYRDRTLEATEMVSQLVNRINDDVNSNQTNVNVNQRNDSNDV